MAKYIMNGSSTLVVFHDDSLKTFAPGEVVESASSPHAWFSLVEAPKAVVKEAPKVAPKPVVKKKSPVLKKESPPKIDLPTSKF